MSGLTGLVWAGMWQNLLRKVLNADLNWSLTFPSFLFLCRCKTGTRIWKSLQHNDDDDGDVDELDEYLVSQWTQEEDIQLT